MIQIDSVTKKYTIGDRNIVALDSISLSVKDHELVAIMGKSGSGKSTLLNVIGGLENIDAGRIIIDDIDISQLTERQLSRFRGQSIGYVFQFFNLIPELTVRENILFPMILNKQKINIPYYHELISILGIGHRQNHLPNQLSGGEQQRTAIARSLIYQPKYLLMDEPTGNLDSESTGVIIEMIKKIYNTTGQTIIIVTHDDDVANVTNSVIKIVDGKIMGDY